MPHCCKGDAKSQWEMAILGVSELRSPWTDLLKIWHTWLCRWVSPNEVNVRCENAMLLGASIGNRACVDAVLMQKLDEFKRLQHRLKLLNVHDAFYRIRVFVTVILRPNCFILWEVCRVSPAQNMTLIYQTLQRILNIQFGDETWQQSTLPVSLGGLGVSEISDRSGTADIPCICHGVSRSYITAVAFSSTSQIQQSSVRRMRGRVSHTLYIGVARGCSGCTCTPSWSAKNSGIICSLLWEKIQNNRGTESTDVLRY